VARTFISETHRGAGGTLGDIIVESAVFAGWWAIPSHSAGRLDLTLAWVLRILFQYFATSR
jgi:hypothetical protein